MATLGVVPPPPASYLAKVRVLALGPVPGAVLLVEGLTSFRHSRLATDANARVVITDASLPLVVVQAGSPEAFLGTPLSLPLLALLPPPSPAATLTAVISPLSSLVLGRHLVRQAPPGGPAPGPLLPSRQDWQRVAQALTGQAADWDYLAQDWPPGSGTALAQLAAQQAVQALVLAACSLLTAALPAAPLLDTTTALWVQLGWALFDPTGPAALAAIPPRSALTDPAFIAGQLALAYARATAQAQAGHSQEAMVAAGPGGAGSLHRRLVATATGVLANLNISQTGALVQAAGRRLQARPRSANQPGTRRELQQISAVQLDSIFAAIAACLADTNARLVDLMDRAQFANDLGATPDPGLFVTLRQLAQVQTVNMTAGLAHVGSALAAAQPSAATAAATTLAGLYSGDALNALVRVPGQAVNVPPLPPLRPRAPDMSGGSDSGLPRPVALGLGLGLGLGGAASVAIAVLGVWLLRRQGSQTRPEAQEGAESELLVDEVGHGSGNQGNGRGATHSPQP
ncbi:hypothetical protein V8C86DRAFT_2510771 [Haematococcus lacustris]